MLFYQQESPDEIAKKAVRQMWEQCQKNRGTDYEEQWYRSTKSKDAHCTFMRLSRKFSE